MSLLEDEIERAFLDPVPRYQYITKQVRAGRTGDAIRSMAGIDPLTLSRVGNAGEIDGIISEIALNKGYWIADRLSIPASPIRNTNLIPIGASESFQEILFEARAQGNRDQTLEPGVFVYDRINNQLTRLKLSTKGDSQIRAILVGLRYRDIQISSDGKTVAILLPLLSSTTGSHLILFDAQTGKEFLRTTHQGGDTNSKLEFLTDNRIFVREGGRFIGDGRIYEFNRSEKKISERLYSPAHRDVSAAAVNLPRHIVLRKGGDAWMSYTGTGQLHSVLVRNLRTDKNVTLNMQPNSEGEVPVISTGTFSDDNRFIYLAFDDRSIGVFSAADGHLIARRTFNDSISQLWQQGSLLASFSFDGNVYIHAIKTNGDIEQVGRMNSMRRGMLLDPRFPLVISNRGHVYVRDRNSISFIQITPRNPYTESRSTSPNVTEFEANEGAKFREYYKTHLSGKKFYEIKNTLGRRAQHWFLWARYGARIQALNPTDSTARAKLFHEISIAELHPEERELWWEPITDVRIGNLERMLEGKTVQEKLDLALFGRAATEQERRNLDQNDRLFTTSELELILRSGLVGQAIAISDR